MKREARYEPPANSFTGAEGFLAGDWQPQPGTTFLAEGSMVRSIVDPKADRGLVGMDVGGRWNKGAADTLSVIMHPDIAEEMGRYLIEAAAAARKDEDRWKRL